MESTRLQHLAAESNLDLVGVAKVGKAVTWEAYRSWLGRGYAGEMERYLARPDAVARRADPRAILPEARTVLMVAASYAGPPHPALLPLHGRVSRYAWGEDYHRWLLARLRRYLRLLEEDLGSFEARCYVDTGPVLEREWARRAGLGWLGKNTNLIHPLWGSYLFLGVALLSIDLDPTPPTSMPDCGSCTRCLEACPTGALVAPGRLDARRCLSYLTIEHRGSVPETLRPKMGSRLFGCDICQEVCPWNRKPSARRGGEPAPPHATLSLPELLFITPETFRARFRETPIWRATPTGLARNAALVLGNLGDPAALPHLTRAIREHPSALVREHAAWAKARLEKT
ncbi:MAG: tRNA epoxyqueuosine(34) reductase QueG [Anaerolineae bacterium]